MPNSISPDGKVLIGNRSTRSGNFAEVPIDVWALSLPEGSSADAKPRPFLESPFVKTAARFSPDGRWVAYQSNESGRNEIYVVPYPGPGGKSQVSTDGGTNPRWARNGRELFYRNGDKMMAVEVSQTGLIKAGGATALVAGLQGAGGGALLTGLLGAIPGAILGAASGGASGAGKGAAVGAGIGIAVGAIAGFYESKTKTEREIISQLGDLYLGAKTSKPGLPVSGFVFLPRGDYVGIYVIAVEEPGGAVHEVYGPMVAQPSG